MHLIKKKWALNLASSSLPFLFAHSSCLSLSPLYSSTLYSFSHPVTNMLAAHLYFLYSISSSPSSAFHRIYSSTLPSLILYLHSVIQSLCFSLSFYIIYSVSFIPVFPFVYSLYLPFTLLLYLFPIIQSACLFFPLSLFIVLAYLLITFKHFASPVLFLPCIPCQTPLTKQLSFNLIFLFLCVFDLQQVFS